MSTARYAIYFVPGADTSLYRFGAAVLGRDGYSGQSVPYLDGVDEGWDSLVCEPCVYGFHATLKPPFYLAGDKSEADLVGAVKTFVAGQPVILAGEIAVRELGSFIALVPATPRPLINKFAESCVREFDRFRAPMSTQEQARRLTPGLTDRQIVNLARWGYSHVCEDFRFHMTLTGALSARKRDQALRVLCDHFEKVPGAASMTIDQIVIARQGMAGAPFQVTFVAPLGQ